MAVYTPSNLINNATEILLPILLKENGHITLPILTSEELRPRRVPVGFGGRLGQNILDSTTHNPKGFASGTALNPRYFAPRPKILCLAVSNPGIPYSGFDWSG